MPFLINKLIIIFLSWNDLSLHGFTLLFGSLWGKVSLGHSSIVAHKMVLITLLLSVKSWRRIRLQTTCSGCIKCWHLFFPKWIWSSGISMTILQRHLLNNLWTVLSCFCECKNYHGQIWGQICYTSEDRYEPGEKTP